jgi:hypothetical protein
MKNKQETFYRLTIKDTANNITEDEPLAFHTESAALDRAYKIMEQHGGIGCMTQVNNSYILWNEDDNTVIEVNPILI